MGAITNLWNSEKAIFGLLLIIAATVLTALGHLNASEWKGYTEWIFGIYVSGKTVQGAVTSITGRSTSSATEPGSPIAPAIEAEGGAP